MQHCSDSQNIFLYRFTSGKDQIDDWFCSKMEKTWSVFALVGWADSFPCGPCSETLVLRKFRNPHDKTFTDRWYDEIDGMISSVQQ